MPLKKARDLELHDDLQVLVYGNVLSAAPVADGKRSDQRQLEFTDGSLVLEFLCRPGRQFHVFDDDDDDDGEDTEVEPVLPPEDELV